MTMRLSLLLALSTCSITFAEEAQTNKHEHSLNEVYYTCSMHPNIRQSKPGKCPICQMNLTKIEVERVIESRDAAESDKLNHTRNDQKNPDQIIASVKIKKSQITHFRPSFFPVTDRKMTKSIRLLGSVSQAESAQSYIPARVEGRVEKVFIQSTGSIIKKGQPVIEFYSPKIIATGEEYLLARKSYENTEKNEFKSLMNQAINRLKLWGIEQSQFQSWYNNGVVPNRIIIVSPETGIVSKRTATVGKYFKEGQNLFELYDLSEVWVEMDVYEHDAALVEINQKIDLEFTALPGKTIEAVVDFISPVLDQRSRTLKIRTTVANDRGDLKPGMIADATLFIVRGEKNLIIPRSAVIDTGKRKVVWIRKSERDFYAKEIKTGFESEGYVEVEDGLSKGELVVIEGNFLLDAQAQLFGGYENLPAENE